jgi:hypothetical protein
MELLITIALTFFVVLSVAAGAASLYLLKVARDRSKSDRESEQRKAGHRENFAAPMGQRTNMESFMSHTSAKSAAPEDMREQIAILNEAWSQSMAQWMYSKEWLKVVEATRAFDNKRMIQETLDLIIHDTDYKQLMSRSRPEDIEGRFHDRGRYSRSA